MTGCFLTVEGLEGVGKTTQIARMRGVLETAGYAVEMTREPGGTPLAERLREIVLSSREPVGADCELLLMFAARSLHLANRIRPALAAGRWVLCDRFTDATYAYQGGGRGLDRALLGQLERLVHPGLRPDLTVLLDAPVEIGLERVRRRDRGRHDRFEREQLEFFRRVRAAYLERAGADPQRFVIIDATADVERVAAAIGLALRRFIERVS